MLSWTVQKQPSTAIHCFLYKDYYTTTSKLKITITRHQKILAAPGNNKKM